MALFAFAIGLTLRRDSQILEFRRMFENREVQFEDPLSGRLYSWPIDKVYREINNGELSVVRSDRDPKEEEIANENISQTLLSLESLPEKYQAQLERRLDYINTAKKQGLTKGCRRLLDALIPKIASRRDEKAPSTSSVMEWWRTLDKHNLNPTALVSGYLMKARAPRITHEITEVIRKILRKEYFTRACHALDRAYLLIKRTLQSMVGIADTPPTVSISTVRRIANEVGPYYKDLSRFGPAYARNKWRYSLGGVNPTRVLERVEVDHTQLDIVVICDRTGLPLGRPTITVIIDAYSGYVISFFVSFWGPGLGPTLNAMKIAIKPKDEYYEGNATLSNPWLGYGLFELAVVDNGLEFHSPQFKLAAWHLNTDIQYCAVRQPWLKPSVERVIGSVGRSLPSTGRVHKPKSNYLPPNPKDTAAITFSELCSGLLKYFVDVHPFEANNRTLIEPFELFRESFECLPPPLLPSSFQDIELIAAMSKKLTIGNEGAVFTYLRYNSVELQNLRKMIQCNYKTTIKFNPDDLNSIYVQNPIQKDWLLVPSCQPEYTQQLSYMQHRAIRSHLGDRLSKRNTLEKLESGKLELIDMYDGFLRGNRRKKNVKAAQQFGTLTSAQSLAPASQSLSIFSTPEQKLIVPSKTEYVVRDIPTFNSFKFD
jgi:putative transposase